MSLIRADARHIPLVDGCVDCCVTSPPYFGLRDYGHPKQIGLQPDAMDYVQELVAVFREVRRVLKDDGTLWLNLGDTYNAYNGNAGPSSSISKGRHDAARPDLARGHGLLWKARKPKDLLGIPWMIAFALQADGWYLRSDIIWHKPNPMPESVTDRPTKSHEYLFLLAKSERYHFDASAIAELASEDSGYAKQRAKGIDTWQYGRTAGGNTTNGIGGTSGTPGTRNKRSVWTVATMPSPQAKSVRRVRVAWDESVDDTTRITSPDCPVHGDQAVLAAKALCGERAVGLLSHTARIDGGHAPAPLLDCVPTGQPLVGYCEAESLGSSVPSHEPIATPHSNQNRRTGHALVTTAPCTPSGGNLDGTADTSASQPLTVEDSRTPASNRPELRGQDVAALAETLGCTVGKCSCAYYRTIAENTSHFATMPEKLVEPCILAGCRSGGLVLDPFIGSGTVGAVAERLGRRWVGTDLSYHDLAKKRTAQRGFIYEATA